MSNQTTAVVSRPSALGVMASKYSVEPTKLLDTLKATVFQGASNDELLALVVVANQYGLNPFTREIYAFPKKGGGIQPVVSIDGWIRVMNDHPQFDGVEFEFDAGDEGGEISCTASIYVKGRSRPVRVTEYHDECVRNTEPWKTCPRRMLRHKALIQCVRVAFGFAIPDEDDAALIAASDTMRDVTPRAEPAKPAAVELLADNPPPTPPTALPSIHGAMSEWMTAAGITFDELRAWGEQTGNIPDASSLGSVEDISPTVVKRLMRDKAGMANQIAAMRTGGAK